MQIRTLYEHALFLIPYYVRAEDNDIDNEKEAQPGEFDHPEGNQDALEPDIVLHVVALNYYTL